MRKVERKLERERRRELRRWYIERAVDRIVELLKPGCCSCHPSCARPEVVKVIEAVIRSTA